MMPIKPSKDLFSLTCVLDVCAARLAVIAARPGLASSVIPVPATQELSSLGLSPESPARPGPAPGE